MVSSSLLVTAVALAVAVGPDAVVGSITSSLQYVLKNTHGSSEYEYPTDITRDIRPIPVHSHNDYWREKPFWTGLSKGCTSTEADVWLYNDTLHVGHDRSSLTEQRTLETLYINPIMDVLDRQNPDSRFLLEPSNNGVWDTDRDQTLYFFIDVKTSGPETFKAVIEALEPLRAKGYLSKVVDGKLKYGPVTVIGTGDTPLDMVTSVPDRDFFFDAPLSKLTEPEFANVDGLISPIGSANFERAVGKVTADTEPVLTDSQLSALRDQISLARSRGIGARYWNTPRYPIRTRNLIWRTLLQEGVKLLNADDLDAVAAYF